MEYSVLIVDQDEPPDGKLAGRLKVLEAAGVRVRHCRGQPEAGLVEGLERDIICDPPAQDLRHCHVVKGGIHFHLLVNEGESPIKTQLTLRQGRSEWFDAWSGQFRPASPLAVDPPRMTLALELGRRESIVLCVDPSEGPAPVLNRGEASGQVRSLVPLAGPWVLLDANGRQLGDSLGEWADLMQLKGFAGTLRYQTKFSLSAPAGAACRLDLGRVGDFAVVTLNGKNLGVRFWAPYQWDVTAALVDGPNELTIEVTNSFANRNAPKLARPSGLFGPVIIETIAGGP